MDADEDGSGELEWHEFEEYVRNVTVQVNLRKLGIEVSDLDHALGVFRLLDFDESGRVKCDDFVNGIQQLHGYARSIDMAHVLHDTKHLNKQFESMMEVLQRILGENYP